MTIISENSGPYVDFMTILVVRLQQNDWADRLRGRNKAEKRLGTKFGHIIFPNKHTNLFYIFQISN